MIGAMPYWIRNLIFLGFVGAFLLITPIVLLYTLGYRINPKNQKISLTAAIAVSTQPRGASLLLNGTPRLELSPTIINQLGAGEYKLIINRDGFLTVEERINLTSGETNLIEHKLIKNSVWQNVAQPELTELLSRAFTESPAKKLTDDSVLFSTVADSQVAVSFNTAPDNILALLPEGQYELLEISPNWILISTNQNHLLFVSLIGNDNLVLPKTGIIYDWNIDEELLYWSDGVEINLFNLTNQSSWLVARPGVPILALTTDETGDWIYSFQENGVWAYNQNTAVKTIELTDLPALELGNSEINQGWKLLIENKDLYLINPYHKLTTGVSYQLY
ncbi:MAG: PEGA domain-containing protein [Patescibacteria group bacterium]